MSRNIIHGFPKKSAAGGLPPQPVKKILTDFFDKLLPPSILPKAKCCFARKALIFKTFLWRVIEMRGGSCPPRAPPLLYCFSLILLFSTVCGGNYPAALSPYFIALFPFYFSFSISSGSNASNSTPYQGALGWAEVCSMQRETKSAAMTPASLRPRPRINPPTTAELKMSPVP